MIEVDHGMLMKVRKRRSSRDLPNGGGADADDPQELKWINET